ncbi:hypothetical protein TB2_010600 [Malus domestica]
MKKHMRSTFLNPKYNPSDRYSVSSSALGGVSATQVQNAKSNSSAHPFKAHNSHTDTDTNNDSNRKSKSKSCGDSMIMYKWSEHLLKDFIEEIAKRLSLKDRVRMGAVCRSWSSAASNCSKQLTRTRNSSQELESVPKILIPWVIESHSSRYSTKVMCSMYNPSENKIYNNLNRFALFPAPVGPKDDDAPISKHVVNYRGIRCLGSVDDWLIISDCVWHKTCRTTNLESAKVRVYLFHPMTGDHVIVVRKRQI